MKDLTPSASVTQQMIDGWKQQYGTVAKMTVKENGETKVVYVRKPTNKEIDFASANLTRGALTQYGITMFNTCQIAGDKLVTEEALRNVGQYMNEMIEAVEVEFEKL
jgi:hypothetical protein